MIKLFFGTSFEPCNRVSRCCRKSFAWTTDQLEVCSFVGKRIAAFDEEFTRANLPFLGDFEDGI